MIRTWQERVGCAKYPQVILFEGVAYYFPCLGSCFPWLGSLLVYLPVATNDACFTSRRMWPAWAPMNDLMSDLI